MVVVVVMMMMACWIIYSMRLLRLLRTIMGCTRYRLKI